MQLGDIIAGAARRRGVDPATMTAIAQIESSMNPRAQNPRSSAGGLFQFINSTARRYNLADRFDPAQASDAAARLAADNASFLRQRLGRDPTPGELYLAHQQGAGGAARLLANANAPAEQVVGSQAFRLNGGRPGMTAGQFAGLWTQRMDRAMQRVGSATPPAPVAQTSQPAPAGPLPPLQVVGSPTPAAVSQAVAQALAAPALMQQRQEERRRAELEAEDRQRMSLVSLFT